MTGIAPWVRRVDDVKAALAVNVEAERKVAQLNEEMQGLVRNLKLKEQNVQEATVKIELMERRMETVKKQADTIADLEGELGKARKQERAYEDAIEQLQKDLDDLEQENQKLKASGAHPERQIAGAVMPETENIQIEGNLETSHLLEQVSDATFKVVSSFLTHLIPSDRGVPRCCTIPTARKRIPQGPGSSQRDSRTASTTLTIC